MCDLQIFGSIVLRQLDAHTLSAIVASKVVRFGVALDSGVNQTAGFEVRQEAFRVQFVVGAELVKHALDDVRSTAAGAVCIDTFHDAVALIFVAVLDTF